MATHAHPCPCLTWTWSRWYSCVQQTYVIRDSYELCTVHCTAKSCTHKVQRMRDCRSVERAVCCCIQLCTSLTSKSTAVLDLALLCSPLSAGSAPAASPSIEAGETDRLPPPSPGLRPAKMAARREIRSPSRPSARRRDGPRSPFVCAAASHRLTEQDSGPAGSLARRAFASRASWRGSSGVHRAERAQSSRLRPSRMPSWRARPSRRDRQESAARTSRC